MIRILVVEDDSSQRKIIEYNLKQRGYESTLVVSVEKAIPILNQGEFHLLISDMKLPGMSGIDLLREVKQLKPELPVIFITAFGTIEKAVEAMRLGAYDYITKPFDRDDFLMKIDKALEYQRLKEENVKLRIELESRGGFADMIGTSEAMQEIFATIRKVAASDATVLISGESGTGKELIARALHKASDRSQKRLVIVNCAAIPKDLLESELFGHITGAFTGAVKDKTGKFVLADGGTIFLDEIGDLNIDLQAKLLRVLQDKMIEPVGSNKNIMVDIRVIAATNQDLADRVQNNRFREDLFYRLNVIPIHIPPLRQRPEDIPLLLSHFLRKFAFDDNITIDHQALEILVAYRWPGNVRELENLVKRLTIFKSGKKIKVGDLPSELSRPREEPEAVPAERGSHSALSSSEIKLITEALKSTGWNQSKAAARLGIPRHVLIYRMKKYDIREK